MTLLVPAVHCPGCGRRPAPRISIFERNEKMRIADSKVVLSYQCRNCGQVYEITAGAYKRAIKSAA